MSAHRSCQEGRIHRGFPRLGPGNSSRMSDSPRHPPPHYRPGLHAHGSPPPGNRSLHVGLTMEENKNEHINAEIQDAAIVFS